MSNGAGIQELMAAETRASQIVAEARIGKCDTTSSWHIDYVIAILSVHCIQYMEMPGMDAAASR